MAGPRAARYVDFRVAPGLFTEETDRGATGRWKNGDNVRWFKGLPEKIGGFVAQPLTDDNGNPATYISKARSNHQWESLDGENWIALGTVCKLYLINNNKLYDITPIRRTVALINPFSTTNGSTTVTVTDVLHDALDGDHVRFSGATPVGGLTINGEYTISVVDQDTYTITASSAATSTATGGGTVQAEYDISCGLESDGTLSGYGTGDYGEEEYGTPRTGSTFGGFARVWSLQNWGEDLLASPSGGTLYYWDRSLGPTSRAVVIPNAPDNIELMLVSPDDRHVIAYGANLISTGEQDRMFIRWCAAEDFDDWTPTTTNDAGSKRLDVGSRIVTAARSRDQILIVTDRAAYGQTFVGAGDVFDFRMLGEAIKPVSKQCSIDVNGTFYFMGEDDFYIYDGTLRVMECDISRLVFGSISRQNQSKVHVRYNKEFTEIWWSYPSSGSAENDRTAIYNTVEKCWYYSSIARECGLDRNTFYNAPVAFRNGQMFIHESGVNAGTLPLSSFIESYDAEIQEGGDVFGLVNHLIPDFKSLTGSVNVNLFGREYPASPLVSTAVRVVNSSTVRVDLRIRKRQIGIRIASTALGVHWRMGTWRFLATPYGRR